MVRKSPRLQLYDQYRLLNTDETARLLHVSRSLIYRLIRHGQLPVVRLGGALRFRPQDVEALIERTQARRARRRPRPKKGSA